MINKYFDNAATSWPKAPGVCEAVERSICDGMGSPGRSDISSQNRLLFDVRESLAQLIHAADSSRIALGFNATQMINIGIQGVIQSGDRVVSTSIEHNAVSRPLRFMQQSRNIDLCIVPCSPEGFIDQSILKQALKQTTRLVVINHSSNVTGAVNDLTSISSIVAESGAIFMVDCAQSVGSVDINMIRDKIDILAGPGHKSLLGPAGTGFLCVSESIQPEPLIHGGTGSRSDLDTQPDNLPDCYESGTLNIHGLAGLLASLSFIHRTGLDSIQDKKRRLGQKLLDGLAAIPSIRLFGPDTVKNRTMSFSIDIKGKDCSDLANRLGECGFIIRTGLHCAPWAHKTAGSYPGGTVRISPGLFHDETDIDTLLVALDRSVGSC